MPGALPLNAIRGKVASEPTQISLRERGGKYDDSFSGKPRFSNHDGIL